MRKRNTKKSIILLAVLSIACICAVSFLLHSKDKDIDETPSAPVVIEPSLPENDKGSVAPPPSVPEDRDVPLTDIRRLGRGLEDSASGSIWFNHSNSGFEFVFSGQGRVDAVFTTDEYSEEAALAWIGVFINGEAEPSQRFALREPSTALTLYESQSAESVTVRIEKLSDLRCAGAALTSLRTSGIDCRIEPTQPREMLIEFIGDSITTGFGNMTQSAADPFSTATEDGSKTYAAITARQLNADIRNISWPGCGMAYSYGSEPTMPILYRLWDFKKSTQGWDFASHEAADYIVISLGTNDGLALALDPAIADGFRTAYADFLVKVREENPRSHIICAIGPMDYSTESYIAECLNAFAGADKNASFLRFEPINQAREGIGSGGHPTALTHERMAETLIEHIEARGN